MEQLYPISGRIKLIQLPASDIINEQEYRIVVKNRRRIKAAYIIPTGFRSEAIKIKESRTASEPSNRVI
ncbi:hypothetical protein CUU66_21965 [Peribacillus deserti]|uniref:Uncharacterized protein n=1 Tax=Peribacillus deserti TaxID=673318 RepID=A0A2N5M0A9_9BACI|nr:hypothetical protein CUU66_21965 [Peribacillus deserti]